MTGTGWQVWQHPAFQGGYSEKYATGKKSCLYACPQLSVTAQGGCQHPWLPKTTLIDPHGSVSPQRERLKAPAFVSLTDGASQLSIRVRAAVGTNCRMAGSWGMWSQSIQAGECLCPIAAHAETGQQADHAQLCPVVCFHLICFFGR